MGLSVVPITSTRLQEGGTLFVEYLLRSFARQVIAEADPVDMGIPEGMDLWCPVERGLEIRQRDMDFVRPTAGLEKQARAALFAETALCFRR